MAIAVCCGCILRTTDAVNLTHLGAMHLVVSVASIPRVLELHKCLLVLRVLGYREHRAAALSLTLQVRLGSHGADVPDLHTARDTQHITGHRGKVTIRWNSGWNTANNGLQRPVRTAYYGL